MAKPNKGAPPVAKPATTVSKEDKDAKALANKEKQLKNLVKLQNMAKSSPEDALDIINMSKSKVTKAELAELLADKKINQVYHDWLINSTEICAKGRTGGTRTPREPREPRTYPKSFAVYHPTDEISPVKGVVPERTPNPKMLKAGTEFYGAFQQFLEEQDANLTIFEQHGMFFSDYFRKGEPVVAKA